MERARRFWRHLRKRRRAGRSPTGSLPPSRPSSPPPSPPSSSSPSSTTATATKNPTTKAPTIRSKSATTNGVAALINQKAKGKGGFTLSRRWRRSCPAHLEVDLTRSVLDETRSKSREGKFASGMVVDDISVDTVDEVQHRSNGKPVYASMTLLQNVTSTVHEVCQKLLKEENKLSLPKPRSNALIRPTSVCAVKNGRKKMEDRHVVIHDLEAIFQEKDIEANNNKKDTNKCDENNNVSFFGVYDGHAGRDAAAFAACRVHERLLASNAYPVDPVEALKDAFATTDSVYLHKGRTESLRSGTTASCVLINNKTIYSAWLGDSQTLLVRNGQPIKINEPHKPNRSDEKRRIEDLGGSVVHWGTWRVNGQLAVSRAIGDGDYKPFISAEPDITTIRMNGNEDFIIVACDGLWDAITPEMATLIVFNQLAKDADNIQDVSKRLVEEAKAEGSSDNISIIVVFFKSVSELVNAAASTTLAKDEQTLTETEKEALYDGISSTCYFINNRKNDENEEKEEDSDEDEDEGENNESVDMFSSSSGGGAIFGETTTSGQSEDTGLNPFAAAAIEQMDQMLASEEFKQGNTAIFDEMERSRQEEEEEDFMAHQDRAWIEKEDFSKDTTDSKRSEKEEESLQVTQLLLNKGLKVDIEEEEEEQEEEQGASLEEILAKAREMPENVDAELVDDDESNDEDDSSSSSSERTGDTEIELSQVNSDSGLKMADRAGLSTEARHEETATSLISSTNAETAVVSGVEDERNTKLIEGGRDDHLEVQRVNEKSLEFESHSQQQSEIVNKEEEEPHAVAKGNVMSKEGDEREPEELQKLEEDEQEDELVEDHPQDKVQLHNQPLEPNDERLGEKLLSDKEHAQEERERREISYETQLEEGQFQQQVEQNESVQQQEVETSSSLISLDSEVKSPVESSTEVETAAENIQEVTKVEEERVDFVSSREVETKESKSSFEQEISIDTTSTTTMTTTVIKTEVNHSVALIDDELQDFEIVDHKTALDIEKDALQGQMGQLLVDYDQEAKKMRETPTEIEDDTEKRKDVEASFLREETNDFLEVDKSSSVVQNEKTDQPLVSIENGNAEVAQNSEAGQPLVSIESDNTEVAQNEESAQPLVSIEGDKTEVNEESDVKEAKVEESELVVETKSETKTTSVVERKTKAPQQPKSAMNSRVKTANSAKTTSTRSTANVKAAAATRTLATGRTPTSSRTATATKAATTTRTHGAASKVATARTTPATRTVAKTTPRTATTTGTPRTTTTSKTTTTSISKSTTSTTTTIASRRVPASPSKKAPTATTKTPLTSTLSSSSSSSSPRSSPAKRPMSAGPKPTVTRVQPIARPTPSSATSRTTTTLRSKPAGTTPSSSTSRPTPTRVTPASTRTSTLRSTPTSSTVANGSVAKRATTPRSTPTTTKTPKAPTSTPTRSTPSRTTTTSSARTIGARTNNGLSKATKSSPTSRPLTKKSNDIKSMASSRAKSGDGDEQLINEIDEKNCESNNMVNDKDDLLINGTEEETKEETLVVVANETEL